MRVSFLGSFLPGMRSSMAWKKCDRACGMAPSSMTKPSRGLSLPSLQSMTLVMVGPMGLYGDGVSRPTAFAFSSVL
jgi:hypothetical protein